jgi:hypothetical protein
MDRVPWQRTALRPEAPANQEMPMRMTRVLSIIGLCGFATGCYESEAALSPENPDAGAIHAAVKKYPFFPDAATVAVSVDENAVFEAPSGTFTSTTYYGEIYDNANNYDIFTRKFTLNYNGAYTGYFLFCASQVSFTTDFEMDLFVNDARERAFTVSTGGVGQGCRTIRLKNKDNVAVKVYQGSGASVTFPWNLYWNWLTVDEVRGIAAANDVTSFYAPSGAFTKVLYGASVPYGGSSAYGASYFDATNNQFVATQAMDANFCAALASFDVDFEMELWKNGARERSFALAKHGAANGCRPLRLAANDRVDVRLYHAADHTQTIWANPYWNWLTVDAVPLRVSLGDVAAFTVPSGWFTTVPYNTVLVDDNSEYDASTGKFTAAEKGNYRFCASLASFNQDFEMDLIINGIRENAFGAGHYGVAQGCRTLRMQQGDWVQIRVYQSSGSPMVVDPNWYWNWLTVQRTEL